MSAVDVLGDLRGVIRIAKAASGGLTGNYQRIERAEKSLAAVAELIASAKIALEALEFEDCGDDFAAKELREALARAGGAK